MITTETISLAPGTSHRKIHVHVYLLKHLFTIAYIKDSHVQWRLEICRFGVEEIA